MLKAALGIDTSNYTTSAACLTGDGVSQNKRLLSVREGEAGLRQSDAVFQHVRQLPDVLSPFLHETSPYDAVGVSDRPRDAEGSYMPCFLAGVGTAQVVAQALGAPLYRFSHQAGHIAAALYSTGRLELIDRTFLAFHVSGGTTEAVLVAPGGGRIFTVSLAASSLDLKAGQAVDRCGLLLGLPFPCGPALERLAIQWEEPVRVRPVLRGADCSLSGIENQCRQLTEKGAPKELVARYCIEAVRAALDGMCAALLRQYGELPILFAGGVSSNSILRSALSTRYGALFAEPAYSADNAAGIAVLASVAAERGMHPCTESGERPMY